MALTAEPAAGGTDEPTLEESRRSPWRILSRVATVAIVVGIAVMWIVAFFGDHPQPGRMADRTFPAAAEPVCARARAAIGRLPRAFESPTPADRAAVVDQGTAELETMVVGLRALLPADPDTRTRLEQWLGDWATFNQDRRDYARRLREDPGARFYASQSERDKAQINLAVDNFARVNDMPSCATPEDVV
jgi:hypothetical protein